MVGCLRADSVVISTTATTFSPGSRQRERSGLAALEVMTRAQPLDFDCSRLCNGCKPGSLSKFSLSLQPCKTAGVPPRGSCAGNTTIDERCLAWDTSLLARGVPFAEGANSMTRNGKMSTPVLALPLPTGKVFSADVSCTHSSITGLFARAATAQ